MKCGVFSINSKVRHITLKRSLKTEDTFWFEGSSKGFHLHIRPISGEE